MMAADKIRPAAVYEIGIRLEPSQRFGFHNFRHSLATFLINKGKDVASLSGKRPQAGHFGRGPRYGMGFSKLSNTGPGLVSWTAVTTSGRELLARSTKHCSGYVV